MSDHEMTLIVPVAKDNERYEAVRRGLTIGLTVAAVGAFIASLFKDHIK